MISRTSLARTAQQALRRSHSVQPLQRRAYAAAASTGAYETNDISGIKVASRDAHGPTTKLAVVAKAGTRYQPLPGLTVGLEEFAFKNTQRRSALRINRESELLGGQLNASHTREGLVIEASFLRDDLPYFAELLGEVISMTKYTTHEFHEDVERVLHLKQATYGRNVAAIALDNAHAVAFHKGLGSPLYPTPTSPSKYLNEDYIAAFAETAYSKPNVAVVAEGASPDALSRWIPQFFKDVPASSSGEGIKSEASTYYGGEQRQSHTGGNAIVIAFPGSDLNASKPEVAVLAALLGGRPTIKWSTGFGLLSQKASSFPGLSAAASNLAYSDAGLLTIQLSGTASSVRQGANAAVTALKEIANGTVSKETISKAVANARFNLLDEATLTEPAVHFTGTGIVQTGKPYDLISQAKAIESVTAEKVQSAAQALISGKATVSAVGDLFVLPYAQEIGLQV